MLVRGESAARHDTVQVGMMHQVLTPGVQDGEEANVSAEMLGIGADRSQRLGGGLKEQVIDHRFVLIGDRRDLFGQRKDHVEVLTIEQLRLPMLDPLRPSQ